MGKEGYDILVKSSAHQVSQNEREELHDDALRSGSLHTANERSRKTHEYKHVAHED